MQKHATAKPTTDLSHSNGIWELIETFDTIPTSANVNGNLDRAHDVG